MSKTFYILFTFRKPAGFEPFARFDIGTDGETAHQLFADLKGNTECGEKDFLLIELMETTKDLPVNLKVKTCRLDDLLENCRLITRSVFRSQFLHDDQPE
jgi:hypothetical protein